MPRIDWGTNSLVYLRIVLMLLRSLGIRTSSSKSTSAVSWDEATFADESTVAPDTNLGMRRTPEVSKDARVARQHYRGGLERLDEQT
jgi:hypothetical protein